MKKITLLFTIFFLMFVVITPAMANYDGGEEFEIIYSQKKINDLDELYERAKNDLNEGPKKLKHYTEIEVNGLEKMEYKLYKTTQKVKELKSKKDPQKTKTSYVTTIFVDVMEVKGIVTPSDSKKSVVRAASTGQKQDYEEVFSSYKVISQMEYDKISDNGNDWIEVTRYNYKWDQYDNQFICTKVTNNYGANGQKYEDGKLLIQVADYGAESYPTSGKFYYDYNSWGHINISISNAYQGQRTHFDIKRGTSESRITLNNGFGDINPDWDFSS